ncbi:formate dehydrogenase accessory protein FdhE [Ammoniphilus sp. CFH 90114]|uniref:formate dehydrogenase accessory protein FdhE n=1 Tax=Ammoniphilus sp. CFH 90114 TaxID=2493665 RepID=UPI00100F5554|nr:formate dehydrogenase accessory protein FdhE [Ammoniphilus sp. CFH 90114]
MLADVVENRLKKLKAQNKSMKTLAGIQADLIKRMNKWTPVINVVQVSEEEKADKLARGDYLLYEWEDQVDLSFARCLFRDLLEWEGVGKAKRSLKKFGKSLADEEVDAVLWSGLSNDEALFSSFIERYELEADMLALLVQYSLLPTLNRVNKEWTKDFSLDGWHQGYCPVCGSHPILAEYRESEKFRFLRCGSCACDWVFPRVGCPQCHNQDYHTLDYLYLEGETKHRVDVCEKCQCYVKGVNALSAQEYPLLLIEDLATLHLDMMAQEKGFYRY